MLAVYLKDLKSYFHTLSGYVFVSVFLLISGIFFALGNVMTANPNYNSVLNDILFIFILVVPILTMRSLAEEAAQKTDRLLFTTPLSLWSIIGGKYLAAVTVFFIALLFTCLFPYSLSLFGSIAVWEILGGIIGFFFLGCVFIAIGVFVSSLTDNQINAAIGTFGALLFIMLVDGVRQYLPMERMPNAIGLAILVVALAGWLWYMTRGWLAPAVVTVVGLAGTGLTFWLSPRLFEGFLFRFLGWFSIISHFRHFTMGILNVSSIVYFISFSIIFLFLTVRTLEKKRWA